MIAFEYEIGTWACAGNRPSVRLLLVFSWSALMCTKDLVGIGFNGAEFGPGGRVVDTGARCLLHMRYCSKYGIRDHLVQPCLT